MNAAYGYSRDRDRRMESGLIGICSGAAVFSLLLVALLLIGKLSATPAPAPAQNLAMACFATSGTNPKPYRHIATAQPDPDFICHGQIAR